MKQTNWDDKTGDSALLEECKPSEEYTASLKAIPPPDPQEKHSAPEDVQNARLGGVTSASPYLLQPHHVQATTRTLHIYYDDWKVSSVRIMDTDKRVELFKVKLQLKKPHLSIASARTGTTIGTATYHSFTSRIDITVHGSPISMTPCGTLGRKGHEYSSPARGSANMRWKYQNHNLDLVCLDEREVPIARFHFSNWSMYKCGKLELIGPTGNEDGAVMEEIIVTGLAIAEYVLTMRLTAVVAAANA
jgi:hypothetical protein